MKLDWTFKPEDLVPTPSLIQQSVDVTMQRVLGKQEQEMKNVLDAHLPEGWTLDDVKARCQLVSMADDPVQTLQLDGKQILEIHPVEFGEVEQRGESYVQTITQKFRRL